jgi:hypothetical protein
MASETSALATFKACKNCSISMSVKLWTCFHCKLDKDTAAGKGVFYSTLSRESAPLADHELAAQLEKRLKKSAPKGYRGTTSTAQG